MQNRGDSHCQVTESHLGNDPSPFVVSTIMRWLFILLVPCWAFAQETPRTTMEELYSGNVGGSFVYTPSKQKEGTKGNPFYSGWVEGTFEFADKTIEAEFRYDCSQDILIVRDPVRKQEVVPEPVKITSFYWDSTRFVQFYNPVIASDEHRYWEVLFEGRTGLYRHHRKYLQEANYEGAYSANKPYDEWKTAKPVYLLHINNQFHKVKLSKKSIGKFFTDDHAWDFIKKERINFKDLEDVKKLLAYIESY